MIIPFIALSIAVLIGMLGLAIDGYVGSVSSAQLNGLAREAAEGALRAYRNTRGAAGAKRHAALEAAARIIEANHLFARKGTALLAPDRSNLRVEFGIWHDEPQPQGTLACGVAPCFEELGKEAGAASAVRLTLRTASDSRVSTFFSRVHGKTGLSISASAIATGQPLHIVALVQLSRSLHQQSHIATDSFSRVAPEFPSIEWEGVTRRTFAPRDAALSGLYAEASHALAGSCLNPGQARVPARGDTYDTLLESRVSASDAPWLQHFQDDYACYDISLRVRDDLSGEETEVSEGILAATGYAEVPLVRGPEPLNSFLQGLADGMRALQTANVPGDYFGILGFDDTYNIMQRQLGPAPSRSAAFEDMRSLFDLEYADEERIRRVLDERARRYLLVTRSEHTYLPGAVRRGRDILVELADRAARFDRAQRHMLIITDGFSNTLRDDCQSGDPGDRSCEHPLDCGLSIGGQGCRAAVNVGELYHGIDQAVGRGVRSALTGSLASHGVAASVLLYGDKAAPHTILAQLSRQEGDTTRYHCVDPLAPNGPLPVAPFPAAGTCFPDLMSLSDLDADPAGQCSHFTYANNLIHLSRQTAGGWYPLRPCCTDESGRCADRSSDFSARCSRSDPGTTNPELFPPRITGGIAGLTAAELDSAGRLLCDPKGRTYREQVADSIKRILDARRVLSFSL